MTQPRLTGSESASARGRGRGQGEPRGRPPGIAPPISDFAFLTAAPPNSPSTRGRPRWSQLTSLSRPPLSGFQAPLNNQFSNTVSSRGGQRGRGGSTTSRSTYMAPGEVERPITEYLGAFISDITLDLDPTTYPVGAVEHVAPIASYSWLDKATPTIAVPGNAITCHTPPH